MDGKTRRMRMIYPKYNTRYTNRLQMKRLSMQISFF